MNRSVITNILFPAILIACAAFVFYPSLNCELTNWEVDEYILNNPYIKSLSIENLKNIFTDIYLINYQPLTHLTFALENHVFGINPSVMHGINVLFHLLNTFLVYFLFRQLTGNVQVAFLTAAFFSIHPLRVESVTWVVELKDVQYAFFYLLSLILYNQYLTKSGTLKGSSLLYYLSSLLCFILSCLTKGMGVSLFLVLFLFDYLLQRKITKNRLIEKIPFLFISILFGVIAVYATHFYGTVEPFKEYLISSYNQYSSVERFLLSCYAIVFYFIKFFLPFNLSVFYPYIIKSDTMPYSYWIFPLVILLFIVSVLLSTKYTRNVVFAIGFFLATIIFILPFHPVNISVVFERYTYLGHCGIAFLVSSTIMFVVRMNDRHRFFNSTHIRLFIYGTLVLWFFFTGNITRQRIDVWKNSVTLWSDYIKKFPGHFLGYLNRGASFGEQGLYNKAIEDFNIAIALNPSDYKSYVNRGNSYVLTKQYDKAVADYTNVLESNTGKPEIYFNRGTARWILKDTLGACDDWRMALQMGYSAAGTIIQKHCNNQNSVNH